MIHLTLLDKQDDLQIELSRQREGGFITFLTHRADPEHALLRDKFLYVKDEAEFAEKCNLIKADPSVCDQLRW